MKWTSYFVLCCTLLVFLQCTRDMGANPEVTKPAQGYDIKISPTIGTQTTPFEISVMYTDQMTTHEPLEFYQIIYGELDSQKKTDWQTIVRSVTLVFTTLGKKKIDVHMRGQSDIIYTMRDSLYVQELSPLTDNTSQYLQGNPDWSFADPDKIAFDWRDAGGEHKIFSASISARTFTQHTFDPGDGTIECHQFPLWSPDGSIIAFRNNSTDEINIVSVENNRVQSLGINGTWPLAWSSDGQRLLIRRTTERVGVWQFNFQDSSYAEILPDCSTASYTAQGDKIVAQYERDYGQSLHIYDAVSFDLLDSYSLSFRSAKISCAPQSSWLCLGSDDNTIYFFNTDTKRRVSFYSPELAYVWWPTWSPDGLSVGVEAVQGNDARSRIWQIELPEDLF